MFSQTSDSAPPLSVYFVEKNSADSSWEKTPGRSKGFPGSRIAAGWKCSAFPAGSQMGRVGRAGWSVAPTVLDLHKETFSSGWQFWVKLSEYYLSTHIESVTKECGARVTVTALPIVILVVVGAPAHHIVGAPVHHPWGRVVIQVVAPPRHTLVPLHPLPHAGHLVGSKACGLFTQIVSLGPAWCTGLMVLESLFLLDTAGSTRTRLISRTYCMQRSKRLSLATRVLADVLYITQKI